MRLLALGQGFVFGVFLGPALLTEAAVAGEQGERLAEETVVRLSIENLRTFPWIAEREAAGKLSLVGLHFGIADGVLRGLKGPGRFQPLE